MRRWIPSLSIISICLFSVVIHLLPFFLHSHNPLGYDTGFYRRYLIQPVISFPNSVVPGLGDDAVVPRIFLDLLRFTGASTNFILYGTYILFFATTPFLIFFLVKKRAGISTALITAVTITISPVQYTAYWYMLWKNMWALCLLLLIFICFEYELFIPLVFLDVALALSHKTTAIIYLATLGVTFFLARGKRLEVFIHATITALGMLAVSPAIYNTVSSTPVGVFIETNEYVTLSIPVVATALIGLWYLIKNKIKLSPIVIAFMVVNISFPLFHLPFYQRIFIFTDVALVLLASYGIAYLLTLIKTDEKKPAFYISLFSICILVGTMLGGLWKQISWLQPVISDANISSIENISSHIPINATILTSSDEAPWFEGWSQSHIAAPGMLNDRHNLESWIAFWDSTSTPEKTRFINSFSTPLYISTFNGFPNLIGKPLPCLEKRSENLLYSKCDNKS